MALGTYNRSRANLKGNGMVHSERHLFQGSLIATADMGIIYAVAGRFTGDLSGRFDLWWGFDETHTFSGDVSAIAAPHEFIATQHNFAGALSLFASPSISVTHHFNGALTTVGAPYLFVSSPFGMFGGSLIVFVNSVQTQETIMTFSNLVVPTGSTVVIDSENCTILLNGQNIIDRYDGDWFDITSNLQGFDVTSATNGIPYVSILYTKRFL